MDKIDFTRTPIQVKREIDRGIEDLSKHLSASKGHGERGTRSLLSALGGLILLILGNYAVVFWFGPSTDANKSVTGLSAREAAAVSRVADRIEVEVDSVAAVKQRVAPAMPIDAQLATLRATASELRSLFLPVEKKAATK